MSIEWFVAPNGSPAPDGSLEMPWPLEEAIGRHNGVSVTKPANPKILPGDLVSLRGGIYHPQTDNGFMAALESNDPTKPIIVKAYNGERVTFECSTHAFVLSCEGANVWWWGIEGRCAGAARQANDSAAGNENPLSYGSRAMKPGVKIINCVIHDTAQGISGYNASPNSEFHGNLSYYNGWRHNPTRPHGHGIYMQNITGFKKVEANIVFDNCDMGIQAYGSGGASITGFDIAKNAIMNSGSVGDGQFKYNLILGGGQNNMGNVVEDNDSFFDLLKDYGYFNFGQYTPSSNNKLNRNRLVGGNIALACEGVKGPLEVLDNLIYTRPTATLLVALAQFVGDSRDGINWDRNRYFGNPKFRSGEYFYDPNIGNNSTRNAGVMDIAAWRANTGYDIHGSFSPDRPTGSDIRIWPNKYEAKRANVLIFNWDLLDAVAVDVSSVLAPGDEYVIRDAQNFYAEPPVASGTYRGGVLAFQMKGLVKGASVGLGTPDHTAPLYGTFIVMPPGPAVPIPQPPPGSEPPPTTGGNMFNAGDRVSVNAPTLNVRSGPDAALAPIGQVVLNEQGTIIEGPTPVGQYVFYKVVFAGVSGFVVEQQLKLATAGPGPVITPHKAVLSWVSSVTSGVTGYNVYRAAIRLNSAPVSGTTYTDNTVQAGQAYTWTVKAISAGGESMPSNQASGTVPVDNPGPGPDPTPVPGIPEPPTGLTVTIS